MGRLRYEEIARGRIKESRDLVVSKAYNKDSGKFEGYSVSEAIQVEDGERLMEVFLKNGLGVLDKEGMYKASCVFQKACEKIGTESE